LKVYANINIKIPEEGEKVKRLVELAKERNIDYKPSSESMTCLMDYVDRKGLQNPLGDGLKHQPIAPVYNPHPGPAPHFDLPPPNYHPQPPPGGDPGFIGGMP
jgi:hypothetical protein